MEPVLGEPVHLVESLVQALDGGLDQLGRGRVALRLAVSQSSQDLDGVAQVAGRRFSPVSGPAALGASSALDWDGHCLQTPLAEPAVYGPAALGASSALDWDGHCLQTPLAEPAVYRAAALGAGKRGGRRKEV